MMTRDNLLKIIKHKLLERHFEESLLFVGIGLLTAVVCAFYAQLFSLIEHFSASFFRDNFYVSLIVAPLAMIASFLLVRWFAPGSSGSGIPQVLVSIETNSTEFTTHFLRKAVIVIKLLSSLLAVFAGAAIGREGPSLQISAAIAWNCGKFSERFGLVIKTQQLLIAGAASGLAAAFNTPIGGIVYAIEELSKEHVRKFRDVLLLSVVISGLTARLINGNYLYLGYPMVSKDYSWWTIFLVALTGLLSGIMGGVFSRFLTFLIQWRSQKSFSFQLMTVALVGLTCVLAFHFLGERNVYSGKESINALLFSEVSIPWYESLSRIFMPLLSSMTGIAGGIFAPSLSAGAVAGGTMAELLDPALRTILTLTGMVGFLTGVTHTPITSFILVLEMTDRHAVVFPMMIAAISSSIGAHIVSQKSFYEESVDLIMKKKAGEQNEDKSP